jgi:transcriptional regulator with XRE-family HTH domain
MKNQSGAAIRALRETIGVTQGELAAMIGASKDTVASWEVGRNKLSRAFARRIALATGVKEEDLLRGRSPLKAHVPMRGDVPFAREIFERHRQSYWGSTDEAAARRHWRNCADALELILMAAARASDGQTAGPLPAVLESFVHWCEQTREDFQLGRAIDELLKERKRELTLTKSYGEWRRMQREDPVMARAMGFKDDPKKDNKEQLRLSTETYPLWRPGHSMRGPAAGKE